MENKENMSAMGLKNKKVVLYLMKAVIQLNHTCNNVIKEEKFKRAIAMFTNRTENFETIKSIIDWHVQNEIKQYLQSLEIKRKFSNRINHKVQPKPKTLAKNPIKKVA